MPRIPRPSPASATAPNGGYASKLRADALRGKRIGLYGPGWRDQPLSAETADALRAARRASSQRAGAILVEDPFRRLRLRGAAAAGTPPLANFDARGLESVPYDLQQYLERLGPDAALKSFADFAAATAAEDAVRAAAACWATCPCCPAFAACLADPSRPPRPVGLHRRCAKPISRSSTQVFARTAPRRAGLPADARARCRRCTAARPSTRRRSARSTSPGLPGVTVPAGYYASGAPFSLIVVGRMWSEADLLAYAYAYEQATRHRRAPH